MFKQDLTTTMVTEIFQAVNHRIENEVIVSERLPTLQATMQDLFLSEVPASDVSDVATFDAWLEATGTTSDLFTETYLIAVAGVAAYDLKMPKKFKFDVAFTMTGGSEVVIDGKIKTVQWNDSDTVQVRAISFDAAVTAAQEILEQDSEGFSSITMGEAVQV